MYSNFNSDNSNNFDDELDVKALFSSLWQEKWLIGGVVTFFSIVSIFYSLSLPNIYSSEAIMSPVQDENASDSMFSNYSALANVAGISLPGQNNNNALNKAKQKLKTLSFFEDSILPNIYLPNLMAVQSWDTATNTIKYDDKLYNEYDSKWVRDFKYPKTQIPSSQESFIVFMKEHLEINEDKSTGFITISIKHQSPFVAKKWVILIVDAINDYYRSKDKFEAQAAIEYLGAQMAQTSYDEVRKVIAQLIQRNTQKLSLTEAGEYYILEYIDPPVVAEKKISPSRSKICFLGAFLGALVGIFLAFLRRYLKGDMSNNNLNVI